MAPTARHVQRRPVPPAKRPRDDGPFLARPDRLRPAAAGPMRRPMTVRSRRDHAPGRQSSGAAAHRTVGRWAVGTSRPDVSRAPRIAALRRAPDRRRPRPQVAGLLRRVPPRPRSHVVATQAPVPATLSSDDVRARRAAGASGASDMAARRALAASRGRPAQGVRRLDRCASRSCGQRNAGGTSGFGRRGPATDGSARLVDRGQEPPREIRPSAHAVDADEPPEPTTVVGRCCASAPSGCTSCSPSTFVWFVVEARRASPSSTGGGSRREHHRSSRPGAHGKRRGVRRDRPAHRCVGIRDIDGRPALRPRGAAAVRRAGAVRAGHAVGARRSRRRRPCRRWLRVRSGRARGRARRRRRAPAAVDDVGEMSTCACTGCSSGRR